MEQKQTTATLETIRGVPIVNGHLIHERMKSVFSSVLEANENDGNPDYEISAVRILPEESDDSSIGRFTYDTKEVVIYMVSLFNLASELTKDKASKLSTLGGCWLDLMFTFSHEVAHSVAWKQDQELVAELMKSNPDELENDCNEMAAGVLCAMAEDSTIDLEPPEFKEIPFLAELFSQAIGEAACDPALRHGVAKQLEMYDKNVLYKNGEDAPSVDSVRAYFLNVLAGKDETSAQGTTEVKFKNGDPAIDQTPIVEPNVDPFKTTTQGNVEQINVSNSVSPEQTMLKEMQAKFDSFNSNLPPDRMEGPAEMEDEVFAMSAFEREETPMETQGDWVKPAATWNNYSTPRPGPAQINPLTAPRPTNEASQPFAPQTMAVSPMTSTMVGAQKSVYQQTYEALDAHLWKFCHPANPAVGAAGVVANPIKLDEKLLMATGFTKCGLRISGPNQNYQIISADIVNGVIHPIQYKNSGLAAFALFHARSGTWVKVIPQNPNKSGDEPNGLSSHANLARAGNKISWVVRDPETWLAKIVNGTYERMI